MNRVILTLALIAIILATAWICVPSAAESVSSFRTVTIQSGEIVQSVRASGTLEPEELIDVGAQVAGKVKSFGTTANGSPIGFGSKVHTGDILLELDAGIYQAKADQAAAGLARAKARVEETKVRITRAEQDHSRLKRLSQGTSVPESELETAQTNVELARAGLTIAEADLTEATAILREAHLNLDHTIIRSPVDGEIIDSRVNVGQTVIASLNAPSLFLLAKNLDRMEVWASINEADIGAIHAGQEVTFSVAAYPGKKHRGIVRAIRTNARVTQNIVTYTVVVGFENSDHMLLPYMTADLRFEVERQSRQKLVPSAALRWRPKREQVHPDTLKIAEPWLTSIQDPAADRDSLNRGGTGVLWTVAGAFVRPIEIVVGLSDAQQTAVEGPELQEGMSIVTGIEPQATVGPARTPFLPQFKRGSKK